MPRSSQDNLCVFSVDVEDWYQSCVDYDAPITERVVRNVDRILAVLDEAGAKGTFFVQGKVAEAFPDLVRVLVMEGHEVQSHGYSHRPLFSMDRTALREELQRAKTTVEDAAGTAIRRRDCGKILGETWAKRYAESSRRILCRWMAAGISMKASCVVTLIG